tara:strand:+ start:266 stop:415 length:150 start_codon:yes stop_codon:yes gene_type:complete
MREFARINKINLHGETKKDRMSAVIAEWETPEFKLRHTKNFGVKKVSAK